MFSKEKKNGMGWLGFAGCILTTIILFIGCIVALNMLVTKVDTVQVVAFYKDLSGQQVEINEQNISEYLYLTETIKDNKPVNTYSTLEEVIADGKVYINGQYSKNELLTKEKVTVEKKIENSYVNRVETSFKVTSFDNAVCGTIRAGDRINITVVDTNGMEKYSKNNIYVADAVTSDGTLIKANDTVSIAVGFKVWLNADELSDFNVNIASGTIKVSKSMQNK